MELKIKWSAKALSNYVIILKRIQQNFGETSAKNFRNRFQNILDLLAKFPELGKMQDSKEDLRGIILY
ncbi:type II toxin-antitoxin system RelE/ParE family toxin [Salegentibacter salegens]|uniref:ParE toxin of type II toxin-antitoxin system, parDE n=1 Tax=Salegentibacter salegens TaxID=143223 RepID=A0A1M7JWY2_9FLAO|nr:type II toxin-antitoxin system RelE/ParE family toxin [Salegentibacter salegens]PRX51971.1 ParE-like toxin of type II ParDE toxin-antitoxin system [Salegentibacter salegens]SHM57508.1 ParE toxin of type II toxin-antitoxin system, parDE [Salegentibacter salegens]